MNVTLIGMAGAGKSHIGRKLAERLGLTMLDIDRDLWETKYGKGIQEILDELGEERYVKEEEQLILEHTAGKNWLLISSPGSVAYESRAMQQLKDISSIIYLRVPYEVVEARLAKKPPRAIIGLGRKSLRELYDERHPLYEKNAHFIVDTHEHEADDVMDEIIGFLRSTR
ncbi:shikimate kinase [Candidatus Kaiserbacteria bacterium]|nr:shikimate kinase [Candidatus Kaiserbacteria bacterium]MBI2612623.1 shikimate kinase [Candidatus Kaiserbacteria bacterium]